MAATIQEINYAGLKITDTMTLSAVIIDIDGRVGSGSGEFYDFVSQQVYPAIAGDVASFGFAFIAQNAQYPAMFNPRITEEYVPQLIAAGGASIIDGDSSGFVLTRYGSTAQAEVIPGSGATVTIANRFQCNLTYKGKVVYAGYSSSNAGMPEIVPVILYRDAETKKLITFNSNAVITAPIICGNQDWYDASASRGIMPALQVPDGLPCNNYAAGYGVSAMAQKPQDETVEEDDITNEIPAGPDPYWNAPDSEPDSSPGTYDYSGNPPGGAGTDPDPSLSATDAGFITIFNPTTAELRSLASYLWSNSFDINIFKKLFNDPMDIFLGLSILPVSIPDGGRIEVGIGLIGTGVFMTKAATQWVTLDCGYKEIPNYTHSYLDYDPYTSVEIYLPFVGSRTLKADEVMGKTLHVTYKIDILSGACAVWVDSGNTNLYVFMGQCAMSVPVASGDWTNVINGVLSVVGGAAGGAVKGGVGGAIAGGVAAASSVAVTDGKISVDRSGAISSAGGFRAPKKPYLVISSPNVCKPANQNTYEGYPLYVTYKIGDLSGFTQIELTNLSNIPATDGELAEIKQLLLSGVIL